MNQDKSHNERGCVEQARSAGGREHRMERRHLQDKDGFSIELMVILIATVQADQRGRVISRGLQSDN